MPMLNTDSRKGGDDTRDGSKILAANIPTTECA